MVIHQGKFMTALDTLHGAQRRRVAFSPGLLPVPAIGTEELGYAAKSGVAYTKG